MDFSFYTKSTKVLVLLGNPKRLIIICKLITYESLSVSDLSRQTKITEDLILQHLRKLTSGNIVISERIGKRLYFKMKDTKTIEIIKILGLFNYCRYK
ncbi:transcriptional regulator [Bacillus thuringiensis serovar andalousiensis]|uniref:Transcriptional regulator n=1 Tax=Bacillus thuringiensis TaxID=1428 RepID=A0A9X6Q195_BACTU|nr:MULTISPECIES: ArsR family transcriptional regulator [Bacillus cereus group]MDA2615319.1 ArsR family transcriptional regulator [Bacillus cereus]MEB8556325.1 ArsR family transcriptional regulator [Bacillus cereus]MEB8725396.1 ArsR family transcriptional regulator [Bacillus cereus]MEB8976470.1 ArsR family transcriptional regulator [Bacillus cereus]MEB9136679.1 ArsR family transcriptional regulator [Bacillus cereus]